MISTTLLYVDTWMGFQTDRLKPPCDWLTISQWVSEHQFENSPRLGVLGQILEYETSRTDLY